MSIDRSAPLACTLVSVSVLVAGASWPVAGSAVAAATRRRRSAWRAASSWRPPRLIVGNPTAQTVPAAGRGAHRQRWPSRARSQERSCARTSPARAMAHGRDAEVAVGGDERAGAHVAPRRPPDRRRAGRGLLRRDRHRVALRRRSRGQLAAALAFCAALAWRRRAPLVPLRSRVVSSSCPTRGPRARGDRLFLVGLLFAIYSAGRHTRGRALIVGVALVVVAVPLAAIEPGEPVAFTDIAFFVVLFGGPLVGRALCRHRSERERVLVAERRRARARGRRRGARADRARAARRRRARDQRHRPAGARRPAHARRRPRRDARRARRRSSTPASRRWPRCAGCSGCCATASRSSRSRRSRACGASTSSSAGIRASGLPVEVVSRASRSSCRRASTSPPTGSSRRR